MRYKTFEIEADVTMEAAHPSNGGKERVVLSNIYINPVLVKIRPEPDRVANKSSRVCMSEEHPLFNLDILNYPVMEIGELDEDIFYMPEYFETITNTIKQEFPQVYRDHGGRI